MYIINSLKFKFFFISFLQQEIYRSTNQKRILETTEKQGHNPCFFSYYGGKEEMEMTGQELVAFAKSKLGVPYVYGME